MRVCYLCPDLGIAPAGPKGGAAHLRGFLRALRELRHEVTLVTPYPGPTLALGGGLEVPIVSAPLPAFAAELASAADPRLGRALGHLWTNLTVERALAGLIDAQRPDLVYERYSPFAAAGTLTCRRLGVPHILEVNAPLAWEGARYRRQALGEAAEAIERVTFERAATIVAVSEELKAMLVAAGVAAAKIVVLPNGVDGELFRPDGPAYRDGLDGQVVVGFVGSLKPWHGLERLIDAFRLAAWDPRLHLLVVGDGPEARHVDGLAAELPGRVTCVGAVAHDEVPTYLRAIDIAVAPYPPLERFYYSPLKVLEYMAAGRAVVASDIGQLRALICDDVTGVRVPPGDAVALAGAIAELADDPERRDRLGSAAATAARSEHLWTQRAARALELARWVA